MNTIFIRLSTKKEGNSNIYKRRAFQGIPALPGYEAVYMPYGAQGRGFYYQKII